MRKALSCGLILWTCAHGLPLLQGAPVDYKEEVAQFNVFSRNHGDWNTPEAWSLGHVPTTAEQAVIDAGSVVVKGKVPVVGSLLIGGRPSASLTIAAGGQLEISERIRVGRGVSSNSGILSLEGGILRTGVDGSGQALRIGDSGTLSSLGQVYLRSGTFEGALLIGSPLPNTGVGTLSIVGSAVAVGGKRPNESIWLQRSGVIEFILDAEGVSTLAYKDAAFGIAQGGKIIVLGDQYKGPSKTIILVSAKRVSDSGAAVDCIGFAKNYAVKTQFDRRGMVLVIRAK